MLVILGLLAANLASYHGTLSLGFLTVDDPDYVQNNDYITPLNAANLKHILTKPHFANYAPANLLSYALDVAIAGGKKAAAIHLSNVLWHGWVICAVYFLAWTITRQLLVATAAGMLFLLHPAHVEVVAWVSCRKDLVAAAFAALAMACYLRYRAKASAQPASQTNSVNPANQAPRAMVAPGFGWYLASVTAYLLASAAKQSVLLLPVVMWLWDLLVEKRRAWRTLLDKVPFGVVTVFFGWMTWHAQPPTHQPANPFTLAAVELTNLWLLSGFGQYALFRAAPDPARVSVGLRLVAMGAAVLAWLLPLLFVRARQPVRAVLSYWILVQMVPPMLLSFVVPVTDRYLFLPSVGVCLLVAHLAGPYIGRPGRLRWVAIAMVGVLASVWSASAWDYLGEWRDPRSVWYGAARKSGTPQVYQFLGEVYQGTGDRLDALLKPGSKLDATNELRNAAAVLGETGIADALLADWAGPKTSTSACRDRLWSLAWEQYELALQHRGTLSTPNLFMTRGRLLVSEGKFQNAIQEFQNALRFAQASSYDLIQQETATHALRAIGVAYWNQGKYREALEWFLKAQQAQQASGHTWIATMDEEIARLRRLAAGQP